MIIRPRPHWLAILFARRGSVLPSILPQLGLVTALATIITTSHGTVLGWKTPLTPMPFTLVGIALAIFWGFAIRPATTATGKRANSGGKG